MNAAKRVRTWSFRVALFVLIALHGASAPARACEPCMPSELLNLEQAVERADLIVIGKRDDVPWLGNDNQGSQGPASIRVKILETLKGKAPEAPITVASWSGMCAYGIVLYKETALLILKRAGDGYAPVSECSPKQFTVEDRTLMVEESRGAERVKVPFMSVEAFVAKYLTETP